MAIISSVSEFSKKTGDFPSLSAVDLKVMALTYQLEKEYCNIEHIKKEPEKKVFWFEHFCLRLSVSCILQLYMDMKHFIGMERNLLNRTLYLQSLGYIYSVHLICSKIPCLVLGTMCKRWRNIKR